MMALPFATLLAALVAGAFGKRNWSVALWALTLLTLGLLYRLHATDPLPLVF